MVLKLNSTDPEEREEGPEDREFSVAETGPGETGGTSFKTAAEAGAREPETGAREPETGAREPETDAREPETGAQQADGPPADTGALESADGSGPPGEPSSAIMADISVAMRELADSSQRYHSRAEQREGVIDLLRTSSTGCAAENAAACCARCSRTCAGCAATCSPRRPRCPHDFDAAKAATLLRSYAETIELTLESNGVVTFVARRR